MKIKRFVHAFYRRFSNGEVVEALYLSYYYLFLFLYDLRYRTDFANSQTPAQGGVPIGGTGNFPGHPRLVQRFIQAANIKPEARILDVGHGSGMVLHVAYNMGFKNISGVEYSKVAFEKSVQNLGDKAILIHGNALTLDMTCYEVIFFYSPFRGQMAKEFFSKIPSNIRTVVTVNHDPIIEPILIQNFKENYSYQHPIYKNFNAKIWLRY